MRYHPLLRLLAVNLALGVAVAALAWGGLLAFDAHGLRGLIARDQSPIVPLALLLFATPASAWVTGLGAVAAMLPDPLQFVHSLFPKEPLNTLQRFHLWIHSKRQLAWLDRSRGKDRLVRLDESRTLAMDVLDEVRRRRAEPLQRRSRILQDRTDRVRIRPRMCLQVQGNHARHVRRRHRRAAQVGKSTQF